MSHNFNKGYKIASDDAQFEKKVREQVRIELGKILAEAQKACDDATKKAQEQAVEERVAKAREAYSAAFKNPKVNTEVVQELTDALTERVKAKGLYDTVETAQEAGQRAVDFAKAILDGYKLFVVDSVSRASINVSTPEDASELVESLLNDPSLIPNQEKVKYEFYLAITSFFASLMNDPSLNANLRAQAENAYTTLTKEWLNLPWQDERVALSVQDIENGFSLIGDLNIVRKAYDLNTVGINLDKDALRVLRYRLMSRIRLEAIHQDYILGLSGDDEDDPDSTDCYLGMLAGRTWR